MIGEKHLNGELSRFPHFFCICVHDESLGRSEYACCLEGTVSFNFNETDPACSYGLYFRQIAECRYMHLCLPCCLQNGSAFLNLDLKTIYR